MQKRLEMSSVPRIYVGQEVFLDTGSGINKTVEA